MLFRSAIIDRDVFQKIQEIRENNRKVWKDRQGRPGYGNVLQGILVCGICHHAMWRNKDAGNGKVQYYFYCGSAYGHSEAKCNTSSIVDHKIFDMVLKQIKLQIELAVEVDNLIERMKKSDSQLVVYRMKKKEAAAGRAVMTIPATQKPNLSSLMPGHYELRTLDRKSVG